MFFCVPNFVCCVVGYDSDGEMHLLTIYIKLIMVSSEAGTGLVMLLPQKHFNISKRIIKIRHFQMHYQNFQMHYQHYQNNQTDMCYVSNCYVICLQL